MERHKMDIIRKEIISRSKTVKRDARAQNLIGEQTDQPVKHF